MPVYTYNSDAAGNCKIRLSAAKLPFCGDIPSGSRSELFVSATPGARKRTGIRARYFVWSTNVGTAQLPNMRYVTAPVFDPAQVSAIPNKVTYKGREYDRGAFKAEDL